MDRITRLKHLIATALGLYMACRIRGEGAEVQLKRLKDLQVTYGREIKSGDV